MSATMKMDGHAGTVLPRIAFLRFRPRQRIKNLKFFFFQARRPDDFNSARTFSVTASISAQVGAISSADLFSSNTFK